jgi:hypothetical protein
MVSKAICRKDGKAVRKILPAAYNISGKNSVNDFCKGK